jgi:DNA mismatch endonuclease, patch repair protein
LPKQNRDFWKTKLEANKKRDRRIQKQLEQGGWRVIILWQCQQKAALAKLTSAVGGLQH